MATKRKPAKPKSKGKKAASSKKAAPAKKAKVKLPPAQAAEARKMLRQIREWHEEAKNGKKGAQRKLVF